MLKIFPAPLKISIANCYHLKQTFMNRLLFPFLNNLRSRLLLPFPLPSVSRLRLRLVAASVFLLASGLSVPAVRAQSPGGFKVTKTFKIGSPGGWDYISVGPDKKIYVSHGTQVNILDQKTGDSVGVIPNTTGVHGIAFAESLGKGYTSNGRLNNVSVFDLKTAQVLRQIPTGQNPDAIMYDPFSKKIITCNGRSHDLTIIDPATDQVVATIALDGKPETAVSDEAGKIYVNIEDKNKISVVDITTNAVLSGWPLSAESPTGLAIDTKTRRLFAGCDKLLVVMDATSGAIVDKLPIADGCDGVGFDGGLKYIFASCGVGKLTVIQENSASSFKVLGDVPTKRSARTLAVDEKTHEVFLPAADTEPAAAGERPKVIPGTFQVLVVSQ
jgi:YVTN family beta-propeller protein